MFLAKKSFQKIYHLIRLRHLILHLEYFFLFFISFSWKYLGSFGVVRQEDVTQVEQHEGWNTDCLMNI